MVPAESEPWKHRAQHCPPPVLVPLGHLKLADDVTVTASTAGITTNADHCAVYIYGNSKTGEGSLS